MVFASASARDTALSSVKSEGNTVFLTDVNSLSVYSGSAWSTVGPVHGGWTSYAASWTSAGGTPPAIGNGTITFLYQRVGRMINFRARIFFGSTSTYGSGGNIWRLSIPSGSDATMPPQMFNTLQHQVAGVIAGSPASAYIPTNVAYIVLGNLSGGAGSLSNSTGAWAANDYVLINGTYECASDA